jgi:ELWxxDGT repeat protein
MAWAVCSWAVAGIAFEGGPAVAATASMVADLNPANPFYPSESVFALQPLGGNMLFAVYNTLWTSDGTVEGTVPIYQFCDSCPIEKFLGTVGNAALLQVDGQLWSTDGTTTGTIPLGYDALFLEDDFQTPAPASIGGAVLLFGCTQPAAGQTCSLLRTDGTPAGTVALTGLPVDDEFRQPFLVAAGGRAFSIVDGVVWTSDGTAAGTVPVHAFPAAAQGQGTQPFALLAAPARAFFVATDAAHGEQLWTSDGTAAGTLPVTRFGSGVSFDFSDSYLVAGGSCFFIANDGTHGDQLYRSDGTAAGTGPVTAFTVPAAFGTPGPPGTQNQAAVLVQVGTRVLFLASDGSHPEDLWSAGTTGEAAPLSGCPGGCPAVPATSILVAAGSRAVFSASTSSTTSLWTSDGTAAGTRALLTENVGSDVLGLTRFAGEALFAWPAGSSAIWITDGTAAGTHLLLQRASIQYPDLGATAGGRLFVAAIPIMRYGGPADQLWVYDKAAGGLEPLTVLSSENASSSPSAIVSYGGGIVFTANQAFWSLGVHGASATVPQPLPATVDNFTPPSYVTLNGDLYFLSTNLWRTDGTPAGTRQVTSFSGYITSLVPFAGRLFMNSTDPPATGAPIWSSDGTTAGMVPLPWLSVSCSAKQLTPAGPLLYFYGGCGANPLDQLWVSDGTTAGTRQLTQLPQDAETVRFAQLVAIGSDLYFTHQGAVWRSDGTAAGTAPLLPQAGLATSQGAQATDLTAFAGGLLFFAYTGNGAQRGLFRTDGTATGTVLLQPVAPLFAGTTSQQPQPEPVPAGFAQLGGALLFAAADAAHGTELWKTDGTADGTVLVADIAPGTASSNPTSLAAAGGLVYFAANDLVHGSELWQSDGTAAGTRLVQDIQPGGASSSPNALAVAGNQLYFGADDGLHGDELWVYPLAAGAGCQPTAQALCLAGSRFSVAASWQDAAGDSGEAQAVALTDDTGYFWFFDPSNVEVVLKTLDGRGVNGHFWTFYGALSNVQYEITETDTQTGAARRYVNPYGLQASVADTTAFGALGANVAGTVTQGPTGRPGTAQVTQLAPPTAADAGAGGGCVPASIRLCLQGGRFAVTAAWQDSAGNHGTASVVPISGDTGYLWFFAPDNVEIMLKVLDGVAVNGKFWVFYGALSNVAYTITVTDTQTGAVRTYTNPAGNLASVADTGAF